MPAIRSAGMNACATDGLTINILQRGRVSAVWMESAYSLPFQCRQDGSSNGLRPGRRCGENTRCGTPARASGMKGENLPSQQELIL